MKKKSALLKRFVQLLEKEVCHHEKNHNTPLYPIATFKPLTLSHKKALPMKNISSKNLKPKETILGEGVHIKGELEFKELLRIHGKYDGDLESKGKVIVGSKGQVKGNIFLDEAEIYGSIFGSICVEKLIIGADAQVYGDIKAKAITIHSGARVSGNIHIDPSFESASTEEKVMQYSG